MKRTPDEQEYICPDGKKYMDSGEQEEMETEEEAGAFLLAHYKQQVTIWRGICFTLCGVLLIVGVLFGVLWHKERVTETIQNDIQTKYATAKERDDLSTAVEAYNAKNMDWKAAVVEIFGLEYLQMKPAGEDTFALYYQNEYYTGESRSEGPSEMKVLMTAENRTMELPAAYALQGDWNAFLPTTESFSQTKYLIFWELDASGRLISILPVEPAQVQVYQKIVVDDICADWFALRAGEEDTVYLTTEDGAEYQYAASASVKEAAEQKNNQALHFMDDSTYAVTEKGISYTSQVYVESGAYYGEFSCVITPNRGDVELTSAKYGAYVPFDYEDMYGSKVITPRESKLTDRVTLSGSGSKRYYLPRYEKIARHEYDFSNMGTDANGYPALFDAEGNQISEIGIDVSKYQEVVDWEKVKEAGIQFAFVRVGYRGAREGTLEADEYAIANIEGALANGIRVGVYFYTQAINAEEGREEAEFVLSIIRDYALDGEVVWDTELYERDGARGNTASRRERTEAGLAFCETIQAAGFTPMIYASTRWSIMNIDRDALSAYPFWFAYYGDSVSYSYAFDYWQYSSKGKVPGVVGNVDMNLRFVPQQ